MFSKVLETAFSGCGVALSDVKRSKRFIECRSRVRRWKKDFPRDSRLGALLRAGPLRASSLINNHSFEEAARRARSLGGDWDYNPDVVAAIDCFGSVLLEACKGAVPAEFESPLNCWDKIGKKAPERLTVEEVRTRWENGTPEERSRIGEMLMLLFRDPDREDDRPRAQSDGDAADHVLPLRYGVWVPGVPHPANCLGRAQLVAAFADFIGARTLSAVPLLDIWLLLAQSRAEVARKVLEFYNGSRLPLKDASRKSLEAIRDNIKRFDDRAQSHHMTVALDVGEGEWMMVDPNFHIQGRFDDDWNVGEIADLCHLLHPVIPGFARLIRNDKMLGYYSPSIRLTDPNCGRVLEIARQVASRPQTKVEIVDALAASPFLDDVTKLIEFELDLPRKCSRRKKAICVLLEYLLKLTSPETAAERLLGGKLQESRGFLWFVFVDSYSEERLLEELGTDDDATSAFQSMVLAYAAQGLTTMSRASDVSMSSKFLQHPVLEFADTRWGLAVATLSHVGMSLGFGAETSEVLNHHAFRQRELVYSAGKPLVTSGEPDRDSRLSAEILQQAKYRSYGARNVLQDLMSLEVPSHVAFEEGVCV